MLMSFGIYFSFLFCNMSHPLSLGFMLMIQTLWISIFIGIFSKTFWFSYILFITFLGGMLILFIYMTSLSSNELFKFSMNSFLMTMFFIFISLLFYFKDLYYFNFLMNMDSLIFSLNNTNINLNILNMNKIYNFPNNFLTILLIIYLLITLIIVVKITDLFYGPMRKNF
uniref:NADH dehydrogenase subunit 6 n=1 Tax=Frontopsylla spadix TaxID=360618 RepID=UPI0024116420|nr:NADH dehydrogenase subunit 6 [Frontopsylla spadix]WEQ92374.1 NADH dehydrogenase subunit 6 [Frontopsylla spadix]